MSLPKILKSGEPITLSWQEPWAYVADADEPLVVFRAAPPSACTPDPEYLAQREICWNNEAARLGKNLWNGTVYTAESITWDGGRLVIELGTAEYKDIVFKRNQGVAEIARAFSDAAIRRHMFTSVLPVDAGGKLLLGRVGALSIQEPGQLDLIGGTLNADEMTLQTLHALREFSIREFLEETGVRLSSRDVRLWSVNHDGDCVFFVFKVEADLETMGQDFVSNQELIELVESDLGSGQASSERLSKDVMFVKSYLHLLGFERV